MKYFLRKKKWMAWVIMLTFLFTSIMPSNLMAGNSVAEAAKSDNQIVQDGSTRYYKGTGTGTIEKPAEAIGAAEAVAGWQASTSKTIQQVVGTENEFDITLQVMTNEDLESYEIERDAAVVLVVDTSLSMQNGKIDKAVEAANKFITDYKQEMSGNAYLSVVTFDNDATLQTDKDGDGWLNLKTENYTLPVPGLVAATNVKAGLDKAKAQLDKMPTTQNKYVILLSDGAPNQGGSRGDNCGHRGHDRHQAAAEFSATAVKDKGAKLYTISYGSGGPTTWLNNYVATPGYGLDASDESKLDTIFEKIYGSIKLLTSAWTVTDPMADHITFLGMYDKDHAYTEGTSSLSRPGDTAKDEPGTVVYSSIDGSNTINWNLLNTPVEGTSAPYKYTMKYRVRLDNTFDGFAEAESYLTNESTKLVYAIKEENSESLKAGPFKVDFLVPSVKGFVGSLNLTKTAADKDKTPLSGAEFKLHYLCSNHTDNSKGNVPTGTTGTDGKLTLANIPSGHIYKLVETKAPEGYEAATEAKYAIKVAFGQVSYCELENGNLPDNPEWVAIPQAGLSLTNNKLPGSKEITITKNWVAPENVTPAVKLEVLQDGEAFALAEILPSGVTVENGHTYITLAAQTAQITTQISTTLTVPQFKPDGTEYAYSVREIVDDNVIITTDGAATIGGGNWYVAFNGLTVTNSYVGTTSVSGTKTWVDGGKVHDNAKEITLVLERVSAKAGSEKETVEAPVSWTGNSYTFSNLPKYDAEGYLYTYMVTETPLADYDSVKDGNDFTNTIKTIGDKTSVSGTKTWVDGGKVHDNAKEITLVLSRYTTDASKAEVAKDAVPTWNGNTYTFSGLDKYDEAGYAYIYTVTETLVNGYDTTYDGYSITNIINQDYVSVSGEKTWNIPSDMDIPVDSVEVQLFRDNGTEPIATTKTVDWKYSFDNLPKYAVGEVAGKNVDGHEYIYTVKEVKVDGFTTKYNGYDIINTYDRSADTEVHVQKQWIDFDTNVTTHSAITIELYQNNVLYDTVQLSDENEWNTTFVELPKYDANQQLFDYTVKEVAVAGYATTILEVEDNQFVVTNTLMLGKPGEIMVEKQTTGDKKPGNDVKFKFELQVQITRPEGTNVLFDTMALNEWELGDAASNLNDAMDAVQANTMLVTSSSQYQYLLTEKASEFATEATALMGVEYEGTTVSAVNFVVTPSELSENEYEYQYNLTKAIVETLVGLSDEYREYTLEDVLVALADEIPLDEEDGYAFAMDMEAVNWLIEASRVYSDLAALEPDAPVTTTPSALQIFMNGSTSPSALTYVADGDYYAVDFWLTNGAKAVFDIQATTGSMISYKIVETLDPVTEKDYVGTSIFDSVNNQTTSGTAIGFVFYNENEPMNYLFTNNYANNPSGGGDGGGEVDPPPEVIIPDPEPPLVEPEDPTEPTEEITDPDVPLIDVPGEEVEISEPEVPLGDAPKTGDANNAVPFVVLMMAAGLGLVITRRRFN